MRKVLFILFAALPAALGAQCLSGAYTIGGLSPDYSTITSAVNALTTSGVCGPVVFNIRNGVYVEQFSLTNISGASYVNTITFQSEALDSTAVRIEYGAATSANYHVAKVSGTDHVNFYKLHVRNTTFNYSTGIFITGSAIGCSVRNCILEATSSPAVGTAAGVYFNNPATDTLTISNCRFIGNYKGISTHIITQTGSHLAVRISDCEFVNQTGVSIYLRQCFRAIVENNYVMPDTLAGGAEAIVVTHSSLDDTIRGNRVISQGFGIVIASSSSAFVYNNMVRTTGSACLYFFASSAAVYHNTFVSTAAVSEAVVQSNVIPVSVRKNVMVHYGGGPLYDIQGTLPVQNNTSQNIYYTSGATFGICNSQTYADLGQWHASCNMDFDSRFSAPQFVSTTDYHVAADFAQNLHTDSLPWIARDIDGDARNGNAPYPGADEGTILFTPDDASAVAIAHPQTSPICAGVVFDIVVRNQGSLALTSVNIHWSINGVHQGVVPWNGVLASGDTTVIAVGPSVWTPGDSIVVRAWTDAPNNGIDAYPQNDSLAYGYFLTTMGGTYTIGGVSPDFATITAAVNKLAAHGVCAPVLFNIRDGIYTERISIPAIPGSSAVNQITFQSETGDSSQVIVESTSSSSATNYTLECNGLSYCRFYQLSILQHGMGFNTALKFRGGCSTIDVSNCRIAADGTAGTSAEGRVLWTSGTNWEGYLTIDSCLFSGGYFGIRMEGSNTRNTYNSITHCRFTQHSYAAVEVRDQGKLTVAYNSYTDTAYRVRGLSFSGLSDSCQIHNNTINGPMITGIYCTFLDATDSTQHPVMIYNNMVSVRSGDTSSTSTSVALFINESSNVHVLFNNFFNATLTGTSYMIGIYYSANGTRDDVVIKNNHVVCAGAGMPVRIEHLQPLQWSADHNNYFTPLGSVGMYNNVLQNTVVAWQMTTTMDQNTLSFNPMFVSDTNLHVQSTQGVNVAVSLAGIGLDYDGDVRSNPPDIGADEFGYNLGMPLFEVQNLQLYPNPADNYCVISLSERGTDPVKYQIVDTYGKTIAGGDAYNINRTATIPLHGISAGNYCIMLSDEAGLIGTARLIIL